MYSVNAVADYYMRVMSAAAALSLTRQAVHGFCADGRLESTRLPTGTTLISASSVARAVELRAAGGWTTGWRR
jgi:hypothetical protein